MLKLLTRLPSFARAQIPLRIGNDSDFVFQREVAGELIRGLPPNYPVVVLTRFPVENGDLELLSPRNVLLKITVTPRSRYLDAPADPYRVLESVSGFSGNLLITVGPLVADNTSEAGALIRAISNSRNPAVYLKPLDKEGLPSLSAIPEVNDSDVRELEQIVVSHGYRLNSFLLCLLFHHFQREDPRSVDIPKRELRYCFDCGSRGSCWVDHDIPDQRFSDIASHLGLQVGGVERTAFRTYRVAVDAPAAYGDEAYFSYMLGRKVRLSTTTAGTLGHTVLASPDVLSRWSRSKFFVASEVAAS
jgi:hypothetical protein